MSEDRRAAIEAAFSDVEEETLATAAPAVVAPVAAPAPADDGLGKGETVNEEVVEPKVESAPKPEDTEAPTKAYSVDKPPQSWRPAQKAKWGALDPEVRQEVIRRERETERVLGDTAQARQLANAFSQTVQPFMARLQSLGSHPMVAVQELLKADHILSTAPKHKRADFMAKLIKDYDIDVEELDRALSGSPAADPLQSKVEQMLQERLQPFQQFIQSQTQQSAAAREAENARTANELVKMAADPKYPEFEVVREDMADIIEISAKKGLYLTLDQAYTRAIAMNPEVSQRVRQQTDQAQRSASAKDANSKAQKALGASKSVSGAPNGSLTGATVSNDRRSTIAAAFDQLEGR